ncbi:hypothetical protein H6P81_020784 [Aristolochia fimbriata]|uniref:BSD domain-containing protein n=1 Tax=Aristolochia fimbriata TaxID=158543 RepID=A0AAV7DX89_ARIFI|nr:hypothetical protein H6P81_020784 [Aristolochia fimbriata]
MSWLAKSIANSLKLDDDDDDDVAAAGERDSGRSASEEGDDYRQISADSPRGVKEDLSELTKTLTRQFWGVASFLAPPPPASASSHSPSLSSSSPSPRSVNASTVERIDPSVSKQSDDPESAGSSPKVSGIRSDFAEIGGRFRTGISKLSTNKAVNEISKIASSFLPFGSEELDDADLGGGAVGVTDEVLAFARNISMHPETWLDFPLFVDDEDSDDFDMSDAQQEHALAVERLAPRLAALRIELCPRHMSEGCFWKIYFVLLHPRLNKHDAELLSTPQIVEARGMLLQELQNRTKPKATDAESGTLRPYVKDVPEEPRPITEIALIRTNALESTSSSIDFETEKHPVESTEIRMIDKSVVEEGPSSQTGHKDVYATSSMLNEKDDDDGDDWLQEDNGEMGGHQVPLGNEEDVSFSDLEDDDESAPTSARTVTDASDSSKCSRDWVQLSKNSGEAAKEGHSSSSPSGTKESNDWLNVDDLEVV